MGSNRVNDMEVIPVSLDPMEGEAVGGSSIKARLEVTYERNAPGLHTSLFVKLPLEPTPESERVYNGKNWWLDEPEGLINLIAQSCPFRTPKCYFWDFSPESTNFIHIWESLEFSDEWEPKEQWVLAKPGLKCKDYELPRNGLERYLALMRSLARLPLLFKQGGSETRRGWPNFTKIWSLCKTATNLIRTQRGQPRQQQRTNLRGCWPPRR